MGLIFINDLGTRKEKGCTRRWALVRCSYCGKDVERRTQQINKLQSCGCATNLKANVVHGAAGTKLYAIWVSMLQRCNNPNNKSYYRYGGRGIEVCKDWCTFEGFYEDMGDTYVEGLSIEREDNNLGYIKTNCSWIPKEDQWKNRHNIGTFKEYKRDLNTLKVKPSDLVFYGQLYAKAKYGEKLAIVLQMRADLNISENTAKNYLAKYLKGLK